MAQTAGDRDTFAIEVADRRAVPGPQMRVVDIWIAGRSVSCDDNVVYVPSFVGRLQSDIDRLRSGADLAPPTAQRTAVDAHRWCRADTTGAAERYWFMHWGETTDNLITHLFRIDEQLVITSEFWRSHMSPADRRNVLVVKLAPAALREVLSSAIDALAQGS